MRQRRRPSAESLLAQTTMSPDKYSFLFTYPDAKQTLSARRVHIRRLYDILELSIHRDDFLRARNAWSILVRCKEINWKIMWKTGASFVATSDNDKSTATRNKVEYLTTMMLQFPEAVSPFRPCRGFPTYTLCRGNQLYKR